MLIATAEHCVRFPPIPDISRAAPLPSRHALSELRALPFTPLLFEALNLLLEQVCTGPANADAASPKSKQCGRTKLNDRASFEKARLLLVNAPSVPEQSTNYQCSGSRGDPLVESSPGICPVGFAIRSCLPRSVQPQPKSALSPSQSSFDLRRLRIVSFPPTADAGLRHKLRSYDFQQCWGLRRQQ